MNTKNVNTKSTKNANTTMTTESTKTPKRDRHVARSARILSTGLSATAILGITAAFGAAERADSKKNQPDVNTPTTALATPVALGAPAPSVPAALPIESVAVLPSPVGTVTLPTGATPVAASADTPAPVTVPDVVATVAPITPAEPPVELTLPPPPTNGSSGGSH